MTSELSDHYGLLDSSAIAGSRDSWSPQIAKILGMYHNLILNYIIDVFCYNLDTFGF